MSQLPPAGQHTVRRHNTALVLTAIATAGAASRATVAARTGLTKATVSALVETLLAADLVAETGQEDRTGRGRRGTELSLAPHGPHALGAEIGVDYLTTCLVGLTGEVRKHRLRTSDNRDATPKRVLGKLAGLIRVALSDAADLEVPVCGIGLAVPGLVDAPTGALRLAPNLGWRDIDLRAELRTRLDLGDSPLSVGNEADYGALAELWVGGHDGLSDFVYVSGEIGVGAGIVIDGALFTGTTSHGGEIGHLPVDPDGPECRCGARGCLERVAGLESTLQRARLSTGKRVDASSFAELLAHLREGDGDALDAVTSAGRWLGIGMSGVINVLSVPTVLLGGRYAELAPWLTEPLAAELSARVIGAPWAPAHVLASTLGPYAAVRGAAMSVVRRILSDPEPFIDGATVGTPNLGRVPSPV